MCTVAVMWLAGIPVADKDVLHLAASLRRSRARRHRRTARTRLRRARVSDREAILRVLEDCSEELVELRATLLQEHVWRRREGL